MTRKHFVPCTIYAEAWRNRHEDFLTLPWFR